MASHYARVLDLHEAAEVRQEVEAFHGASRSRRTPEDSLTRLVRVEGLSRFAATLLAEVAAEVRAGFFVDGSVPLLWEKKPRSALLLATRRQYRVLDQRLRTWSGEGLRDLAPAIRQALDAYESASSGPLQVGRHALPLGRRTLVMGIINVTPDSFSGDGLGANVQAAVDQAKRFAEEGADLLDIGGQSTRPGSEEVAVEVEQARVLPVLERLAAEVDLPLSIDTSRAEVARVALEAGAGMVNDVGALRGEGMLALVAERRVPVCLMHMLGTPRTMQDAPRYADVVSDVYRFLADRVQACVQVGLDRGRIFVDPGIGFGKTVNHNLTLLRRLREFRSLGCPVMVGTSRKSTIGKALGGLPESQRLEGTAATCAAAVMNGADLLRVHDVRSMVRVARMTDALLRGMAEE